jgi:hypothetical protein
MPRSKEGHVGATIVSTSDHDFGTIFAFEINPNNHMTTPSLSIIKT